MEVQETRRHLRQIRNTQEVDVDYTGVIALYYQELYIVHV